MSNDVWTTPSSINVVEGETKPINIKWKGVGTPVTPTSTVFRGAEDITSTVKPGSDTMNGSTQSLSSITAVDGDGSRKYVINAQVIDSAGDKHIRKLQLNIISKTKDRVA